MVGLEPMKYLAYTLGAIWSLPLLIISAPVMLLFYRPTSIRWRSGCIETVAGRRKDGSTRIWFKPGAGQAFSILMAFTSVEMRDDPRAQRHERTHVLQALWGGIVWAAAYVLELGLRWLWCLLSGTRELMPDGRVLSAFRTAYRALTWERMARSREQAEGAWGSA